MTPLEAANERINDFIDLWHDGDGADQPLHEYLGMTWEEYGQWVADFQNVPTRFL